MTKTLILGASSNPNRYAYKAQQLLIQNGHDVVLVSPKGGTINGMKCFHRLDEVNQEIDTITVYVRPEIFAELIEDIVKLNPRRVILNPGTEFKPAADRFKEAGIEVTEACTLVLLTLESY